MAQVTTYLSKDTFPASTALTGTVSNGYRNDSLIGTGTAFTTECQEGDWFYVDAHDVLAKIINIVSDTEMRLDRETVALSGETAAVLPNLDYTFISIKPVGGDCDINGVTHTTSDPVTWERSYGGRRFEPVIIDPTSSALLSFGL